MLLGEDRRAGSAGVRASIVAAKSRNGDGAKGRRKVESNGKRERRQTGVSVGGLSESEKLFGGKEEGTFGLDGTDVDEPL